MNSSKTKLYLTLKNDFVLLRDFPAIRTIRADSRKEFQRLKTGKNATNKLLRGIRWGTLINNKIHWNQRNTYQLPNEINEEESGSTRKFTLISDEFVNNEVINDTILEKFDTWQFSEPSDWRSYEVQLSLIGYVATLTETAFPAPVTVHRDLIDGSVTVLDLEGEMDGGVTRVFDLSGNMIVESQLGIGESIFMVDEPTRHVVTPISVPYQSKTGYVRRLLMIVRFQPVGR